MYISRSFVYIKRRNFSAARTPIGHADRVHTVGGTIAFFSFWFVANIVFFFIGLYTIRNSHKTARFFNKVGSGMYGKKVADRVYTPNNLLLAAWGFVIMAPIFIGVGVWAMVSSLAHAR